MNQQRTEVVSNSECNASDGKVLQKRHCAQQFGSSIEHKPVFP